MKTEFKDFFKSRVLSHYSSPYSFNKRCIPAFIFHIGPIHRIKPGTGDNNKCPGAKNSYEKLGKQEKGIYRYNPN
jgi:hypothetical protein